MSVLFYPESIRILGSDASGNNVMLCEMAVDDIANLPAANAFISDGYVLSMGCEAIAINDNSKHRMNSQGQWVQIAAGTSTYTRAEIDAFLSAIDADQQIQNAAIAGVIDKGAKNKLNNTASSAIVGEVVFTVNDDGTVTAYTTATTAASRSLQIASSGYVDSTDICTGTPDVAYDINAQFGIGDSGNIKNIAPGDAVTAGVSGNIRYFSIYIRAGVNIPQVNAITFRPMICSEAAWNSSHAYEPYAPTNRQLYEMILQLQGG